MLNSALVENVMFNMKSDHFVSVLTKPTRFGNNQTTSSLIDHVWLNNPSLYLSEIILNDFTSFTKLCSNAKYLLCIKS